MKIHGSFDVLRLLNCVSWTGPDALAVAIHDVVVDYGIMHRVVEYNKFLKYSSLVTVNPEYLQLNKSHYSDLGSTPLYWSNDSVT